MKKRIAKILMCFGITVVLTACGSNGVALEKRGSLDDNNSFEKNSNSENEIEFSEENSDQQQETSYGLEEDRLGDDYTLVDRKKQQYSWKFEYEYYKWRRNCLSGWMVLL